MVKKEGARMTKDTLEITPTTTVYEMLNTYPELEDKLIEMAPPFKKLKNPALRKSVARVATLKHISSVGNIPLTELINKIRAEVGQPLSSDTYDEEVYFTAKPDWFSKEKISASLVEGEAGDKDKMTVVAVLREAKRINTGEIIELITTFLPAPGIDSMRAKGYSVWTTKSEGETVRTYFLKN
jgi:hypothetical protein